MESLSGFTASPKIPAPAWASPSVSALWNAAADVSGSNPNLELARHFTLRSHAEDLHEISPGQRVFSILLVEDNQADAGLVREALEEYSVPGELLVIPDGDKAIRFVRALDEHSAKCPDLVIVDLNLPRQPGSEVLKAMRQSPVCRNATVIILSSSDAQTDVTAAFNLGATKYIRKPLRLDDFLKLGAVFKSILEAPY